MIVALSGFYNHEEIMMWYYNEKGVLLVYNSAFDFTLISVHHDLDSVRRFEAKFHVIIHDDGEE